eukprot:305491_1
MSGRLSIRNIIDVQAAEEYKSILSALATIDKAIKNKLENNECKMEMKLDDGIIKLTTAIMKQTLTSLHSYGKQMVSQFVENIKELNLDCCLLREPRFKFLADLFLFSEHDWIKVNHRLFPNLTKISLEMVDLNKYVMDKILNTLEKQNELKLQGIFLSETIGNGPVVVEVYKKRLALIGYKIQCNVTNRKSNICISSGSTQELQELISTVDVITHESHSETIKGWDKVNGWSYCGNCYSRIIRYDLKRRYDDSTHVGCVKCGAEYCDVCGKELDAMSRVSHYFKSPNKCKLWKYK